MVITPLATRSRPLASTRLHVSFRARWRSSAAPRTAPYSMARAMESVWCHDCRAHVDVDASAFDDAARECACPSCAGIFLERLREERSKPHRGVLSVFFGPALSLLPFGPFGDIDLTLLDTRNFDAPASAAAVEALQERTVAEAELPSGATCSVCLCEFEGEERVKTIPKCSHTFHVNCLMDWLRLVRESTSRERREKTDAENSATRARCAGVRSRIRPLNPPSRVSDHCELYHSA